ncbi:hypothetical protein D3C71_1509450 [compost metagenome]
MLTAFIGAGQHQHHHEPHGVGQHVPPIGHAAQHHAQHRLLNLPAVQPRQVLAEFDRVARQQGGNRQRQHARPDERAVQQKRPTHRHHIPHEPAQERIGRAIQGNHGQQRGYGKQGGKGAPVESQGHGGIRQRVKGQLTA